MTAGRRSHFTKDSLTSENQPVLYLALELSCETWKLAFSTTPGQPARRRDMAARNLLVLWSEIAEAKRRLKLPADCPVVSCYEAGRDGFWLHRCLVARGVQNLIVDSASIEVSRRRRRAKNDRLDAEKLLSMLLRYAGGERSLWSVVQVPTPEEEDARQLHRELIALKQETTEHTNRIKGLLASHGLALSTIDKHFPKKLAELKQWDGTPVPTGLHARLLREFELMQVCNRQIRALCQQRSKEVRKTNSPTIEKIRKLLTLQGIGLNSAWLYVHEFFGWRKFKNRKQVGSLAGLAPTPYSSGGTKYEQGISKAGNKHVRWMAIEIAWGWLRFQPQSELSQWFMRRFADGSKQRRIGIVALARKLLVQLWKYLETGTPPAGAELVEWREKTGCSINTLEEA